MRAGSAVDAQVKEDPEVRQMMEHISQYRRLLKKHGLQRATQSLPSGLSLAAELVLGLIIGVLALLPAVILNAPVGLVARIMAWREAKRAVANSRVKIKGRDVVSSYKILVSLVLVPSWYGVHLAEVYRAAQSTQCRHFRHSLESIRR